MRKFGGEIETNGHIQRYAFKDWNKEYILNYAKQFTWEEIAEKVMEVYDEALKES